MSGRLKLTPPTMKWKLHIKSTNRGKKKEKKKINLKAHTHTQRTNRPIKNKNKPNSHKGEKVNNKYINK